MSQLDDLVQLVVSEFVKDNTLFTALDVSNKVKETMPFASHRQTRDIVRGLFTSDMETQGYARTPIKVTLDDGSSVDALLYHSLADSWDLDSKYDTQKRTQSSRNNPVPATVSSSGTVTVSPVIAPLPPVTVSAPTSAMSQWQQLFNSQTSLFPRK